MLVSLSVPVVFGSHCIFLTTRRAAEQLSRISLVPDGSAPVLQPPAGSGLGRAGWLWGRLSGRLSRDLCSTAYCEWAFLSPSSLTFWRVFLSCILAPTYQRVGNYSVFFTSKQLPMEKYLVIGFEKSYFINWSMFKFAFTVALLKVKSNLANALVQNFCWLNINRIWPLELLAERLFSCCFNFIGLIWMTYLYLRCSQDKIGLRFIAEMCFSRPLKDSQDL